jgi:hypothetical protein
MTGSSKSHVKQNSPDDVVPAFGRMVCCVPTLVVVEAPEKETVTMPLDAGSVVDDTIRRAGPPPN